MSYYSKHVLRLFDPGWLNGASPFGSIWRKSFSKESSQRVQLSHTHIYMAKWKQWWWYLRVSLWAGVRTKVKEWMIQIWRSEDAWQELKTRSFKAFPFTLKISNMNSILSISISWIEKGNYRDACIVKEGKILFALMKG